MEKERRRDEASALRPSDISEEEVAAAGEGRSEEVLAAKEAERQPIDLSEDQLTAASEGRSEEVIFLRMKEKEREGRRAKK